MAFIEFQASASSFLAMEQVALQQGSICPPPPQTFAGIEFRVDHIEFGSNSFRHSVPYTADIVYLEFDVPRSTSVTGLLTQLAQRITIFMDTTANILASPNSTPPGLTPIGLTAVFDVAYYPVDAQCYLQFRLNAIGLEFDPFPALPPGVDPNVLKQTLTNILTPLFPAKAINFSFANVLTNAAVTVQNADVSIGGDGAFISFLAQLGDLDPAVADNVWQQFLQGNIADRRAGSDWALFFPKDYFEDFFEVQVEENLGTASKFDLISGWSTYFNDAGKVRMVTQLDGNVHLPDPLTTKYVSVSVTSVVSVASANTLQIDTTLPNDQDLINAFLGPFAATLRMLGPLSIALQGLAGDATAGVIPPPKNPACKQVAAGRYTCTRAVNPPALPGGGAIQVTSLVGQDDGISFGGKMNPIPLTPPVLSVTVGEYKWRPPQVNCASAGFEIVAAFGNNPYAFATAHGSVLLDNSGTTPVSVCGIQVLNDPTGAFPMSAISVPPTPLPVQITIDAPVPSSGYYAAPYPCDLLITTTGGVRLIRLMPAPALTQEDIDKLEAEIVVELGNCEKLVDPWTYLRGGYNPHWSVDPPVDRQVEHIWEFAVSGLPEGDTVALLDAQGREQMRAFAHSSETMYLSARLAPAGENEVTLMRSGNAALPSGNAHTRLAVGQQLLIRAAVIPLEFSCRDLRYAPLFGRKSVTAVGENVVSLFSLSNPFRPEFVRSWNLPGARGTLALERRLIAFGDGGFCELAEKGQPRAAGASCGCARILDAESRGGVVYALTDGGLEVYNSRLCRIAEVPMRTGSVMQRNGDRLFVGGAHGLWLYDISDAERHVEMASTETLRVAKLGLPPLATKDSVVAVRADGTALHVRFSGKNLQELAAFRESPWFVGNVRIGKTLVAVGNGGAYLDIAVLGDSVGA
jgi:hypothetical protein